MIDRKEIELLVRAQLKGGADLKSVAESIKAIETAIDGQVAAAKRGESSIDELKSSLLALQQVQDKLKGQADLVGTFQRLAEQIQTTEQRVTKTAKSYEDYKNKLAALAEVTDKQQEKLIRLSTASERAATTLSKQTGQYEAVAQALRDAGIETDNLAAAETRVRQAAVEIGVAIQKTQQAIGTYAVDVKAARDALAEKQAVEKQATRDAKLFAEAEDRAAEASRRRAADAADVARIIADRQARGAADTLQFGEQSAEAARARELAALKADIIARSEEQLAVEKKLAKDSSLVKAADDARDAARAYGSLARASTDLRPKTASLRDTINGIINPSQEARKSLSGLETEVESIAAAVGRINGPVTDYQAQIRALADANKALANQASLIDDFQRQAAALRQSRNEFTAARAKVNEYAAAVRQGGEAGESFTRKLAEVKEKARLAGKALETQLAATRASRDSLRAAGIQTGNLVAAQDRLTKSARTTVATTKDLTAAVEKYGTTVEGTGRKFKGFNDGGRTTLSLMQRIRGEVLALTATYVGLQGAIGLAGRTIEVFSSREGLKNQLALSVGNDRATIDAEYDYVRGQAERIGIEFEKSIKGYAKFSAAATLAGRSRQEIRSIWESFAEVGRVANLTADDLDGVFKALEQITSKGSIQAEELRGQLGDRLFGAFEVAAKALKDQFPDLEKAMKGGQVGAEQLVRIAEEYRRIVADQLPGAQKSLAAGQARLNNAVFDFQAAVADSGWADTYREMLPAITEFLRSDDGKEFAKTLSDGFSFIGDLIVVLLQNFDKVKLALEIIASLFAVKIARSGVSGLVKIKEQAGDLVSVLRAGGAQVDDFAGKWPRLAKIVKGALGVIVAATIGWQVGKWANEEFAIVRQAGVSLVTGLEIAWTRIKYGAEILFKEIPRFAYNAFAAIFNTVTFHIRAILGVFEQALRAIGKTSAADTVGAMLDRMTLKFEEQGSEVSKLREQMEKDILAIQDIGAEMFADAERKPVVIPSPVAEPTPSPGVTPGKNKTDVDEKAIAKRQALVEEIQAALEKLDAKIERSQKETLSSQLAAVDLQYAKLARRIGELGGEAGAAFLKHLGDSTAALKTQITSKFNADLLKEQEALTSKLEQLDAAAGRKEKESLDARLKAISLTYEQTYRDIAALREKLLANGRDTTPADQAKARLDGGIAELKNLERKKFATDELKRLEAGLNDLLATRSDRLQTIRDSEEASLITSAEARAQTEEAITSIQPQIASMVEISIAFAESMRGAFDPLVIDAFIAKMELARGSAGGLQKEFKLTDKQIEEMIAQRATGAFESMASSIGAAIAGQKSWSGAIKETGRAFLQFAADFVREIALMIIKAKILKAIQASGAGGVIGAAASAAVQHAGGLVGGTQNRTRNVAAAWFHNAPRYQTGGIAGLSSDEYATILHKNEEVLTADSPRNILNGGGLGQKAQGDSAGTKFVLVDDRSRVSEAMTSAEGEKVVMVHLRNNIPTLRQLLK